MTTTTTDETARRVRVTYEPLPGAKPWRAVIVGGGEYDDIRRVAELPPTEVFVGRFDEQLEAITTGVSALRFVSAGIPWRPTGGPS